MSLDYSDNWNYHIINGTLFRTLKTDTMLTYKYIDLRMYGGVEKGWLSYSSTTNTGIIIRNQKISSKDEVFLELL